MLQVPLEANLFGLLLDTSLSPTRKQDTQGDGWRVLYFLMFLRDSRILDMSLLSNLVSIRCNIQLEHFSDRYSTLNHMYVCYILDQPSADHISSITLIYYRMYLSPLSSPKSFYRIRLRKCLCDSQSTAKKIITVLETPYIQYYRKYVTAAITAN